MPWGRQIMRLGSRWKENSPCRQQEWEGKQRVRMALASHRPLPRPLWATIDGARAGRAGAALTPHQGSLPRTPVGARGDGHAPCNAALPALSPAIPVGGCQVPRTKPGGTAAPGPPARQALPALLAKSGALQEAHSCGAGFTARLGFPHRNARRHRAFQWSVSPFSRVMSFHCSEL